MATLSRRPLKRTRYLMADALALSTDLINEDIVAYDTIARRAFVFIEEAARVSPFDYTSEEAEEVIEKFRQAMNRYADPPVGDDSDA
jgi:hypothetical protein